MSADLEKIRAELSRPFRPDQVDWKPQTVKGNRAMAVAYVTARTVMDRLDDVLGVGNWQTSYRPFGDGVVCCLRAKVGDIWVLHEDVGSPSEQPDDGDRLKASFSDSLKRAAIHLGVARYLYELPHQWLDWDAQKKQFTQKPVLPDFALPADQRKGEAPEKPAQKAPEKAPEKADGKPQPNPMPKDGHELYERLRAFDAKLAGLNLIQPGGLIQAVVQAGMAAGYPPVIADWRGPAVAFGVDEAKRFNATLARPE